MGDISGKWNHVAATYNGSTRTIYLNGILKGSDSPGGHSGTATSYKIGCNAYAGYYDGQIDELRIWNVARTETQIRSNMCKKINPQSESNLVAYYSFDQNIGNTTVSDHKANCNGTMINMDASTDWVTSGAPIGDASICSYSSPSSLSLSHNDGDCVTLSAITGSPAGVHIYRVDDTPSCATLPGCWGKLDDLRYWGVFMTGGTSPSYTLAYNYNGHPDIVEPSFLGLASRANNADTAWTPLPAALNTSTSTLSISLQTGTEYIMGSSQGDYSLPVVISEFKVSQNRNDVLIEWATESEIENQGFILERSCDDTPSEWVEVTSYLTNNNLKGQGNTSEKTTYRYIDRSVEAGKRYSYRLFSVDYSGSLELLEFNSIITHEELVPEEFTVLPAYPNPFNPTTTIKYSIPENAHINISIFDIRGREVATLINSTQNAGWHTVQWNALNNDGQSVSTGMYLCVVRIPEESRCFKLLLFK